MKFKPMRDRVLIKRQQEDQKTKGGVLIPETASEKSLMGEVVEVGDGKVMKNGDIYQLPLKKGDVVLFGKYSGTEIKLEDEDYLILKSDEILGYQSK
jgi:chaperonin GroES